MILKQCNKCGKPVVYPAKYCGDCEIVLGISQQESKTKYRREYNKKRNKQHICFYKSKAWQRLSHKYMADKKYKCEVCGRLATEVHHIVPLDKDWSLRLNYNNLKALCTKCHNKIHNRFGAGEV